jgi:hypothetical protein
MKTHRRIMINLHTFFISALDAVEWSASEAGRFVLGQNASGTYWIGCRVESKYRLHAMAYRKSLLPQGTVLFSQCSL